MTTPDNRDDHERRVRKEMNRCVHFTGIQHDECKVGVNYQSLLGSGDGWAAHMPCLADDGATVVCEQRQLATEAEARQIVAEHDAAIADFLNEMAQGICSTCKVEVRQRQVGSCVYGACGHRLYQGKVNPKYAETV